jgi:hypothetical protein
MQQSFISMQICEQRASQVCFHRWREQPEEQDTPTAHLLILQGTAKGWRFKKFGLGVLQGGLAGKAQKASQKCGPPDTCGSVNKRGRQRPKKKTHLRYVQLCGWARATDQHAKFCKRMMYLPHWALTIGNPIVL